MAREIKNEDPCAVVRSSANAISAQVMASLKDGDAVALLLKRDDLDMLIEVLGDYTGKRHRALVKEYLADLLQLRRLTFDA